MKDKIIKRRNDGAFYASDLDGLNLEEAVDFLKTNVREGTKLDYDFDGGYNMYTEREETDEEYEARISAEIMKTKILEDREKATYLKLKAKYEGI
jgi:hypothetical protein